MFDYMLAYLQLYLASLPIMKRERSIRLMGLEYTLYPCEKEFNHSKLYHLLEICIVIIKVEKIWNYVLVGIVFQDKKAHG